MYLCFDVGGTYVKYGVLTKEGDFIKRGFYATNCLDLDQFMDAIFNVVSEIQSTYNLKGIGVSLPGYIDSQSGYSELAGAIRALDGQNLKKLMEKRIEIKIEIENDANCVVLAEKFNGNAVNCNNFICLTVGTGIGGGIVLNGQIITGHRFKAGEFGMMIMSDYGKPYENMHNVASTKALIDAYKSYKGLCEDELIEGFTVFEEAKVDQSLASIVDKWYRHLSHGIYNLASILNPEKILIGGAISIREDLYVELEKRLEELEKWSDIAVKVEPCRHRNDAGMLGILYKLVY